MLRPNGVMRALPTWHASSKRFVLFPIGFTPTHLAARLAHRQGFLFNVRQQRAAGYAAMELGQALREAAAARRAGRQNQEGWARNEAGRAYIPLRRTLHGQIPVRLQGIAAGE